MQFTDTSEKGFQKYIVKELCTKGGYIQSVSNDFDKEFCINTKQIFSFIEQTQPEKYEMIHRKGERAFLVRLDEKLRKLGVIEVLRKGVKHFDKTIDLFYRQPSSAYNVKDLEKYNANIFSITQELAYSNENANRLDLTVFLNGIPIITTELKNPLSGQTVHNGIRQYQNDRDPKEKIFSFARCMVHFAADTELVYMTTELKGKKSFFMPFNKGLNNGKSTGKFGAGNPVNPNGLKTHYFWEEILSKDSLSNIIDKFAQVIEEKNEDTMPDGRRTGKTKRKMIFPRYHQITAVRAILAHAKKQRIGDWKKLLEWFPENKYVDVEGLCKIVELEEIKENDYSLTPGRYVGYSIQIDEDFNYKARITEIHSELATLNTEANDLMNQIQSVEL